MTTQSLSNHQPDRAESIEKAARIVAHGLVSFYNGNETGRTPGILDDAGSEWDWWLAGKICLYPS
jgi:mannan endo-1,6-alpha-mannosidase